MQAEDDAVEMPRGARVSLEGTFAIENPGAERATVKCQHLASPHFSWVEC